MGNVRYAKGSVIFMKCMRRVHGVFEGAACYEKNKEESLTWLM